MTARTPIPPATLGFLALLLGATSIGFAPIFVRLAEVGPVSSAFWRLLLSIPVLLLLARLEPKSDAGETAPPRPWALVRCGLFFAADLGLWHWSITLTSVANATLFANLNVVFVVIAGYLFFRERVTRMFLLGLLLALGGVSALVSSSLQFAPERLPGDVLGVATAMMYAGYILSAKSLRPRYSAVQVLLYIAMVTAAALLPVALLMGEQVLPTTAAGWLPLIGLALICQIGGQGLVIYALAHLPANFSALTLLVQPIVASTAAWMLFGEILGTLEFIGAGLILTGILAARLSMRNA